MDTNQIKHLEMIQGVIERMARNSFFYKGWALIVAVFAALLILSTNNCRLVELLGITPLLGFWGLDAYYLKQERLFRKLYDSIRVKSDTDFSMDTSEFSSLECWRKIIFSKSVLWFYLPMIIIIIGVFVIFGWKIPSTPMCT